VIVVTAGHVDHGKSELVRFLSGAEPDRLQEEKRRGLTLDLGFTWRTTGTGRRYGLVDVPGHWKYVANMLAGSTSADAFLLAISAREGWMPQTEEHVEILSQLGVTTGVVALTHSDLVSSSELDRSAKLVSDYLAGTPFAAAEMVLTSTLDPSSMETLGRRLDSLVDRHPPRRDENRPRMWIDRSFTLDGIGRIVTGTLTGGSLEIGQGVDLWSGSAARGLRIRSLHEMGEPVTAARPGCRVAANLVGDLPATGRGTVLGAAGGWLTGRRLHAVLEPARLEKARLKSGGHVVFLGTAKRAATIQMLVDGAQILARLHLSEPLGGLQLGDRFVIRNDGVGAVAGGGLVVAVDDDGIRYSPENLLRRHAALKAQAEGAPDAKHDLAELILEPHGGCAPRALLRASIGTDQMAGIKLVQGEAVAEAAITARADAMLAEVDRGGRFVPPTDPVGRCAVSRLLASGAVERVRGELAAPGVRAKLRNSVLMAHTSEAMAQGCPFVELDRLSDLTGLPAAMVSELCAEGELIKISGKLIRQEDLSRLVELVYAQVVGEGATVSQIRSMLGLSRKYAVPLLEYLDDIDITARHGNIRRPGSATGEHFVRNSRYPAQ
jgi:selenocysteine-specific elongation factor